MSTINDYKKNQLENNKEIFAMDLPYISLRWLSEDQMKDWITEYKKTKTAKAEAKTKAE